jgi:predicted DNA-binding WGR domain protein
VSFFDSTLELDRLVRVREADLTPEDTIQYLVLERRDPAANMARFYVLALEETLFGDAALVREWGRIGTTGQRKVELHESSTGRPKASSCSPTMRCTSTSC